MEHKDLLLTDIIRLNNSGGSCFPDISVGEQCLWHGRKLENNFSFENECKILPIND